MKRIISLCCVVLAFMMSMAVPVKATEIPQSNWFNVLDYTTVDGTDNFIGVSSGVNTVSLPLPGRMGLYHIDILVGFNGSFSGVSISANGATSNLTVSKINSRLFRIYGDAPSIIASQFDLNFNVASGTYLNFLQINISSVAVDRFDINAKCEIVTAEYTNTINFVPTDEINHRIFSAVPEYNETWFILYIYADSWRNYDYIDVQLMLDVFDITSVSAVMGSANLPLDVSHIDGTSIEGNSFFLNMRLDLTELDRASSDYPMITIMGRLDAGVTNSVDFVNCSGFVLTNTVNPLMYYFTMVKSWISSQTSSLTSTLSNNFDALKIRLTDLFTSVQNIIQNQTLVIENKFLSLQNNISSNFNDLNASLNSYTSRIEHAIRGETRDGQAFQEDVSSKDKQLDQMASVMDSVQKPNVENINVSIDSYVSSSDVQLLATPLSAFLELDLFRTIIIMSILLATVSFTLYGKR